MGARVGFVRSGGDWLCFVNSRPARREISMQRSAATGVRAADLYWVRLALAWHVRSEAGCRSVNHRVESVTRSIDGGFVIAGRDAERTTDPSRVPW